MHHEPMNPSAVQHTAVYRVPCPHACEGGAAVAITIDDNRNVLDITVTCRESASHQSRPNVDFDDANSPQYWPFPR